MSLFVQILSCEKKKNFKRFAVSYFLSLQASRPCKRRKTNFLYQEWGKDAMNFSTDEFSMNLFRSAIYFQFVYHIFLSFPLSLLRIFLSSVVQLEPTWHHGWWRHQEIDAGGARPVTKECHVARVTTEQRHILLDPMQCCYLVHQPVIGNSSLQMRRQVGIQEP